MNKITKAWTIIAAVLTGGVAITAFTFAGPLADAALTQNQLAEELLVGIFRPLQLFTTQAVNQMVILAKVQFFACPKENLVYYYRDCNRGVSMQCLVQIGPLAYAGFKVN